eukprot:10489322-Alexandrium_andersonii.AAC.1
MSASLVGSEMCIRDSSRQLSARRRRSLGPGNLCCPLSAVPFPRVHCSRPSPPLQRLQRRGTVLSLIHI